MDRVHIYDIYQLGDPRQGTFKTSVAGDSPCVTREGKLPNYNDCFVLLGRHCAIYFLASPGNIIVSS